MRDLTDGIEHFAQRDGFSEDILEPIALINLLTQTPVLLLYSPRLQSARNQDLDFIQIERLGNKIVSPPFHSLDRGIHRTVGGHHDTNWRLRQLERTIDQLHPVFSPE